jgi:hypothetical protein
LGFALAQGCGTTCQQLKNLEYTIGTKKVTIFTFEDWNLKIKGGGGTLLGLPKELAMQLIQQCSNVAMRPMDCQCCCDLAPALAIYCAM